MKMKPLEEVMSKGEAENIAIQWQRWASEQSLSYGELSQYQMYFWTLGKKFGLTDVFQENGII
jgi:hypothetical protein